MKTVHPIVAWFADSTFSAALLIGGLSLAIAVGAPFWMVPVFLVPFAAYLHFRLAPRGQGVRWFVVLTLVVFLVRAFQAVPPSPTLKVGILLILLAFAKFCGRRLKQSEQIAKP